MDILFENKTSNGDSDIIEIKDGGYRNIKATGTFDGAIITLYVDYRDDDYAPLVEDNIAQTITTPGDLSLQPFRPGMRFKATLSSAGGSTDVTLKLL